MNVVLQNIQLIMYDNKVRHRIIPWKKLSNDRKVWRTSNSTHEKNNIWMPQSKHYPYLILQKRNEKCRSMILD
jgi:hypothetical protein